LTTTLNPRFRSGPWTAETPITEAGDLDGVVITERLATRADQAGAVVRLENGHVAVLGESFAVGAPRMLRLWATRRLASVTAPDDRAWWTQVRRAVGA
jgi:hypothetical protein